MAANTGYTTIKLRRDTTTNWTTGTKTLDTGEVGLDTTTGKIKFGTADGQAWASAKNVAVIQSDLATSVNGGAAGSVLYQSSSSTTEKLPIGNTGTFLSSNGSVPSWTTPKLSAFAATTSAELITVVSDETGSGALVFGTSPSITSATLTTPTIGGAGVTFNGSSSGTVVLRATAAAGSGTLILPVPSGTETLITSTTAGTTYLAKAGGTMSGALNMGSNAISGVTTFTASGDVTFSNYGSDSGTVAKLDTGGQLMAGYINLGNSNDVYGTVLTGNGGFGVSMSTSPIGATSLAKSRSVIRIFVQSTQPGTSNPTGYTAAVGDLWFW
jgi:hypothetical protein